jgi:uncharacterized protein (DUF1697 family)
MSERWVALLRGINVGRANRVAMADLRALIAGLGFTDVRTLLNSGNAVFTAADDAADDPAACIQEALAAELGVAARVIAVTAADLATVVRENTLARVAGEPSRLLVAFLAQPADRARLIGLLARDWAPEALAVGSRSAYLWCADGVSDSRLWQAVSVEVGHAVTSRNWATVLRLVDLAGGPSGADGTPHGANDE